jgi:hypothetical protein
MRYLPVGNASRPSSFGTFYSRCALEEVFDISCMLSFVEFWDFSSIRAVIVDALDACKWCVMVI